MSDSTAKNLDFNQESDEAEKPDKTMEMLENEYHVDTADIKNSEGLTYCILDLVVNHQYERAIKELKKYFEYKSTFPTYKFQTERLFEHIENVIQAIKTKKSLIVVPNLTASKKKELHGTVIHHFRDLKSSLQKVTQIEYAIRIKDSRSTLWVLNTLVICAFVILMVALLQEAYYSLSAPLEVIERDIGRVVIKYFKL
jgi:hypothetical protein